MDISRSVMPQTAVMVKDNSVSSIKIGDVSSIVIKERSENNEAQVTIKGQDFKVKFDGPIPTDDRVLVKVTQQGENGQLTVKPVTNQASPAAPGKTIDNILQKAGFDSIAQPELKEAVRLIVSKGGSVTKDTIATLQDFLQNGSGTIVDKLDTIEVMQQKNIEFTKVQLQAINTALHGEALTETLSKLFDGPLEIKPVEARVNPSQTRTKPDLKAVIEDAIAKIKNGGKPEAAAEKVLSLLNPSSDKEAIEAIKKALQITQAGKGRIAEEAQKLEKIGTMKLLSALQGLMAEGAGRIGVS
ncbi:hypothetical protein RCG23_14780 [Neobacillus sp. PS3-34]|uniref:hypothetical protein n=1 Tax=Neobacillus sp. PS3-34 TaxID=3070678 RepID=UPI0027E08D4A|nr:hypothetical protein [Neobacillus sp. PS3-34]WML46895.1 hypothetical protein RCG23_14780 [Neobacillus sp. PS3-34]